MLLGIGLSLLGGVAIAFVATRPGGLALGDALLAAMVWLLGVVLFLLGGLVFLVGLVLYVVLPSLSPERAREGYGSHRTVLSCLLLAVVLSQLVSTPLLLWLRLIEPVTWGSGASANIRISPGGLVVAILGIELSLMAVVYLRILRPGVIRWQDMGLRAAGLWKKLLVGAGAGLGLLVAMAMIGQVMVRLGLEAEQTAISIPVIQASAAEFLAVLAAGVLIAPLVEEIFFRGYIFRAYLAQKGVWQAYLFSALIFSFVHLFGGEGLLWGAIPPVFVMGLGLAFVYHHSGSVVPAVVAHALNNLTVLTAIYAVGR